MTVKRIGPLVRPAECQVGGASYTCVGNGACNVVGPEDAHNCTEPVPACKLNIPYADEVAVLARNTHYRLGDIVNASGGNWRSSSLAVLTNPIFRGTMMREVLWSEVTLNGAKLRELVMTDSDLEERMVEESLKEGGRGFFCNTRHLLSALDVSVLK